MGLTRSTKDLVYNKLVLQRAKSPVGPKLLDGHKFDKENFAKKELGDNLEDSNQLCARAILCIVSLCGLSNAIRLSMPRWNCIIC